MATFAVINQGIVTNIIVADTQVIAEAVTGSSCVEYTEANPASIGWIYDGTNFVAPTSEESNV